MQLLLWRHADAEEGWPDLERRLTARGRDQAKAMAAWIKPRLPARCKVLVSPARRAQETAAALAIAHAVTEPRIAPGASVAAVMEAVHAAAGDDPQAAVLVVGHQPWLGEVAADLVTGQADHWSVRKAGLWWLVEQGRGLWRIHAVMDRELIGDRG